MLPSQLNAGQFKSYPPEARAIVTARIELLRQLPLAFLGLFLRELIAYDWKFPAERKELDQQLAYMGSLDEERLKHLMKRFAEVRLSRELEGTDWVGDPQGFSEKLSAHLWVTRQIDSFRAAAIEFDRVIAAAQTPAPLPLARLGIAVIGRGIAETRYPLFRKLRREGVYFRRIKPDGGFQALLDAVAARADAHPVPFGHWYVDGGMPAAIQSPNITCVSYAGLAGVRREVLGKMRAAFESGMGPEALRTRLARLRPEDLGLKDGILNRFQISLLTEGSGTQLFSTTFVQWCAREVLRRAQPLTSLARFAPRQRDEPMRELLAGEQAPPDPEGSLVDADMGAYYTWIDLQRLSGAERSCFVAWFEDHSEAAAVTPTLPRGTESDTEWDIGELMRHML